MKKIAICLSLLVGQVWSLSCSAPVTISEPGQRVKEPKVAMNEEGNALITWRLKDSSKGGKKLVAATLNDEKKWVTTIISDCGKNIFEKTFVDASGNNAAFWRLTKKDDEGNTSDVYQFSRQEKNQAWSSPVNVGGVGYLSRAFDSQGNLVIFGFSRTSNKIFGEALKNGQKKETEIAKIERGIERGFVSNELLVKNKNDGFFAIWTENGSTYDPKRGFIWEETLKGSWFNNDASWSMPEKIFSREASHSFSTFRAVMNSHKEMVIVWDKGSNSLRKVQALTYLNGSWSEPTCLGESKEYTYCTPVMNDQGHTAVCWEGKQTGKKVVWIAEKPTGQPWSSPMALTDPSKKSDLSKLHIDEEGNIFVLWTTKEGKNDALYFAEKQVGQSWSSPIPLTDSSKNVMELDIKIDKRGNALLVLAYEEKGEWVPYAMYRPAHQAWKAPVCLSDGLLSCGDVQIETTDLGHFVVVWEEFSKEQSSIHGAALSTATGEWSSATLSPELLEFGQFSFKLNKNGQGIVAWNLDDCVQVVELSVN